MSVAVIETRTVTTTVRKEINLGFTEIRRLLEAQGVALPADVSITITVPGGGDWSNVQLDVDDRNPVVIAWTEKT